MKIDVTGREFSLILSALSSYRIELYKNSKKKDVEKWRKKNLENEGKAVEKLLNDFTKDVRKNDLN